MTFADPVPEQTVHPYLLKSKFFAWQNGLSSGNGDLEGSGTEVKFCK